MVRNRILLKSVLLAFLFTQLSNSVSAQVVTTDIIALGSDYGPNGLGKWVDSGFTAPVINDAGQVAFHGATSLPFQGPVLGVFRSDGFAAVRLVRQGEPAPSGNGNIYTFGSLAINDLGETIFPGGVASVGPINDGGLYSVSSGSVNQIARQGQSVPNGNGAFPVFSTSNSTPFTPAINNNGQIAFSIDLVGTTGGTADSSTVFRTDGTTLTQIARAGQAAPDGNGTFSFVGDPSLNESGQAAFYASLTGTTKNNGIFRGDGNTLTTIARVGESAVDGRTITGFLSGGKPDMNESGQVAFTASLSGAAHDNVRVFVGDGTTLTQIAREGQSTPNGTGIFTGFTSPALNDAGQAAFIGHISSSSPLGDAGIFVGNGSSLIQAARTGQLAPDGNGTLVVGVDAPALNNSGQVAFLSWLTGTSGGNNDDRGLYFFDQTLGLTQIAREGAPMLGSTVINLQFASGATSSGGRLGNERGGLNDAGQVAYKFDLADGRSGIAVASVFGALAGNPIAGMIGGGAAIAGGLDFILSAAQGSTGLTVDYQLATSDQLPSGEPFSIGNFILQAIGNIFQIWDIDFEGGLSEPATLTFGYDPAFHGTNFGIWHYHEVRGWEYLGGVIDSSNRTITVQTDSFSPFVAAAAPDDPGSGITPEPTSLIVWFALIGSATLARPSHD